MDIPALQASPAADAAVSEITRYGLERNVVELNEFEARWNLADKEGHERMDAILGAAAGHRLTYQDLTA